MVQLFWLSIRAKSHFYSVEPQDCRVADMLVADTEIGKSSEESKVNQYHDKRYVAVIGLGYVGLSLARLFSTFQRPVLGIDIDMAKVALLESSKSPISELTDEEVAEMTHTGFKVTSGFESISQASTIIVALPTPVTGDNVPNLGPLLSGIESLAPHLKDRALVVVESTIAPGTMTNEVLPAIEKYGKKLGKDFLLGFSPERVDPGGINGRPEKVAKIVSGIDDDSLEALTELYSSIGLKLVQARSVIDAESAKLLENTYRAVNIALVNQLAPGLMSMGANIAEVVRLASTKTFGFQAFYPGPGVGGHCIPIDPWYLEKAIVDVGKPATLTRLSMQINSEMPTQVANRLLQIVKNQLPQEGYGNSVLLLGMTYKADVDDFRGAPGLELAKQLADHHLRVGYHDPYLSSSLKELRDLTWEKNLADAPTRYQACFVVQEHKEYTPLIMEWEKSGWFIVNLGGGERNGVPSIWDPAL